MTQGGAQFLLFLLGGYLTAMGFGLMADGVRRGGIWLLTVGILFMLPALLALLQATLLALFTLLRLALLGGTP